MDEHSLPEVQRFRPYCLPPQAGQVRLNQNGLYVRWADYQRLHMALSELFVKCLAYAPAALTPSMDKAREALDKHVDWDRVFRGTSDEGHCNCYSVEGDSETCPRHTHSAPEQS